MAERDVLYQRTFREARASARLSHPGVVTVHDVIEEDGRPWIVMELVRARSLQDVIDEDGPVTPRTAADIGRQVLAALSHAHQAGILHRDVKPSNVLITEDGRAVLTDFGIAQVEGDATLTQTGLVMGSPAYIPPERVQGERAVPASDLWALGATLYAAVEGKAPYERSDAMSALAAALTEEVPPPRNAGSLRRVLHGLLARTPAERMTANTAMPLLTEVANERVVPQFPRQPPVDETLLDQPAKRQESAALETVLDSAELQAVARDSLAARERAALRDSATSRENTAAAQRPVAFRHESGPRSEDEMRTEIQPDWQPPAHDPWRQPTSPAHQPAYGQQPYAQAPQRPGGTKTVVIVLIAAIVVAASLIAGALILKSRTSSSGSNTTSSGSNTTSTTPAAQQSSLETSGYTTGTGPGFLIAVPSDWTREPSGNSVLWYPTGKTSLLQVDTTVWVGAAKDQADQADMKGSKNTHFPEYVRKKLEAVSYKGGEAADWEFTFNDPVTGVAQHVQDRFFTAGGRSYAIYFRTPESRWTSSQAYLDNFYDSFRAS
jgi:serine/threonine protein kinase